MLELKDLHGGYRKTVIIKGIACKFPEGKITSIIGPNGSGKSTLLKLCCGLLQPTGGEILLGGTSLSTLSRKERSQKISYLPQASSLPPITVRSLVAHGRHPHLGYPRVLTDKDRAIIDRSVESVGMTEYADRVITELSGGLLQRARIAMLLAVDSDVLLLDEPLTFLDVRHQLDLLRLIADLKSYGKTIIIVMHDIAHALNCSDLVAILDTGRLSAFGAPEEIARSMQFHSAFGVTPSHSPDGKWYI